MQTIKAIETCYAGCHFRSRLEARWAVFFDALGIKWEYEPEGYVLSDGTCYLPDFWLPRHRWFVEVKPEGGDFTKAQLLAEGTARNVLAAEGLPSARDYTFFHRGSNDLIKHLKDAYNLNWMPRTSFKDANWWSDDILFDSGLLWPHVIAASSEAMSARFGT